MVSVVSWNWCSVRFFIVNVMFGWSVIGSFIVLLLVIGLSVGVRFLLQCKGCFGMVDGLVLLCC